MEKIKLLARLLPLISMLVSVVEQSLKLPKAGETKLAIIKEILLAAENGLTEFWPLIERLIAKIVDANNVSGDFRKTEDFGNK